MQRRSFIQTALAAIALIAFPVVAKAIQPSKLEQLRDALLPGVWATFNGTGFDYKIDVCHGSLLVIAWLPGNYAHTALGFAITEKHIDDKLYVYSFGPSLLALRDDLLTRHGMMDDFKETTRQADLRWKNNKVWPMVAS